MAENGSNLTGRQIEAAQLLADDDRSDREIAVAVGVSERQLNRWKTNPEFQSAVAEFTARALATAMRRNVARRAYRITKLNELEAKTLAVIEARSADSTMANVPGGNTGLIVRQLKAVGSGQNAEIVEEYVYDRGIVSELRALYDQAAAETGQKVEKVEHGGGIRRELVIVPPERAS